MDTKDKGGSDFKLGNITVDELGSFLSNKAVVGVLTSVVREAMKDDMTAIHTSIGETEKRITTAIKERPTKPAVLLTGVGLAVFAFIAGACELHWGEISHFLTFHIF